MAESRALAAPSLGEQFKRDAERALSSGLYQQALQHYENYLKATGEKADAATVERVVALRAFVAFIPNVVPDFQLAEINKKPTRLQGYVNALVGLAGAGERLEFGARLPLHAAKFVPANKAFIASFSQTILSKGEVVSMCFQRCQLPDVTLRLLAPIFVAHATLTELDLSGNGNNKYFAAFLPEILAKRTLRILQVDAHQFRYQDTLRAANAISKSRSLQALSLHGLAQTSQLTICRALERNRSLTKVHLWSRSIYRLEGVSWFGALNQALDNNRFLWDLDLTQGKLRHNLVAKYPLLQERIARNQRNQMRGERAWAEVAIVFAALRATADSSIRFSVLALVTSIISFNSGDSNPLGRKHHADTELPYVEDTQVVPFRAMQRSSNHGNAAERPKLLLKFQGLFGTKYFRREFPQEFPSNAAAHSQKKRKQRG